MALVLGLDLIIDQYPDKIKRLLPFSNAKQLPAAYFFPQAVEIVSWLRPCHDYYHRVYPGLS